MAEAVGHPQQPQAAEEGHGGTGDPAEAVPEDSASQAFITALSASAFDRWPSTLEHAAPSPQCSFPSYSTLGGGGGGGATVHTSMHTNYDHK